jgi:hypothetical protein
MAPAVVGEQRAPVVEGDPCLVGVGGVGGGGAASAQQPGEEHGGRGQHDHADERRDDEFDEGDPGVVGAQFSQPLLQHDCAVVIETDRPAQLTLTLIWRSDPVGQAPVTLGVGSTCTERATV